MSFKASLFQGKNMIRVNHIKNKKVGPKDVLIRVRVCGICGTDMHIYHGLPGSVESTPPVILGH